jgi:sterol desaturase/sphingolipid hydroxylase (fatty acid hydroxylase superfamily)
VINHRVPLLWRFHRIHHNDPAMDMSTALRFHPVEIMLFSMLNIIVIAIIGMTLEYLIVYKGIFHANVLFHHSNFKISPKADRLMRALPVSPHMHRIHHSQLREETDSSFL